MAATADDVTKTSVKDSSSQNKKPVKTAKSKAPAKPNIFARFVQYIKDVISELKRVVWPTRPEVLNSSVVVIVTLLFFIAFTFLVDTLSTEFVSLVSKIGG